jgi:hypothetical protein
MADYIHKLYAPGRALGDGGNQANYEGLMLDQNGRPIFVLGILLEDDFYSDPLKGKERVVKLFSSTGQRYLGNIETGILGGESADLIDSILFAYINYMNMWKEAEENNWALCINGDSCFAYFVDYNNLDPKQWVVRPDGQP